MANKEEKEAEIWAKDILDYRSVIEKDQEFNNLLMFDTTHPEIPSNTVIKLLK